ncbi:MAG: hypothetical protein MJ180_00985 [Candidatus Gastranaerophilales bacterium]|nr:hypothetical protein [Candidatus Gastranaerophilales bacterium]
MAQAQTTSIPYNGSGTINIHINNPSASLGTSMPNVVPLMPQSPYYQAYPYYAYPANYYLGGMNQPVNQTTTVNAPAYPYPYAIPNNNGNNADNKNTAITDTKNVISIDKQPKKEREIVVLTDNYIKNLENYLRTNNSELRKNAAKELLLRFKEEKSRVDNPSLTALLNLALQDTNETVRATAMSIIQSGYAKGDKLTEKILGAMQQQKTSYSTDATQAADSLLQMSKTKVKVPDNSFYPVDTKDKKKGS